MNLSKLRPGHDFNYKTGDSDLNFDFKEHIREAFHIYYQSYC